MSLQSTENFQQITGSALESRGLLHVSFIPGSALESRGLLADSFIPKVTRGGGLEEGIGRDFRVARAWRIYADALRYCKFTVFERLGASNSNP